MRQNRAEKIGGVGLRRGLEVKIKEGERRFITTPSLTLRGARCTVNSG